MQTSFSFPARMAIHIETLLRRLLLCLLLLGVSVHAQSPLPKNGAEPNRLDSSRPISPLDETERALRAALTHDQRNIKTLIGLADIARTKMRYAESLAVLLQSLQYAEETNSDTTHAASPNPPSDALNALGSLYLALEDFSKAEEYYRRLQKAAPDDPRGTLGLAHIALSRQRYEECKTAVQGVLRRHPQLAPAHALLAQIYIEENRPTEAAQSAERAVALAPNNSETLSALCSVRIMEKNPEAVRALAQKILVLNPYNIRIRRILSQYVHSKKSYPVAPSDAQQAFRTGLTAARNRDYAQAVVAYDTATEKAPGFIQAFLGLGAAALSGGFYEQAIRAAERSVQLDPENALAQLQLSLAYLERHERSRRECGVADSAAQGASASSPNAPPPEIADVFINYAGLSAPQRESLLKSIYPFAHFLPELKRRGAKHYLLALDQQLVDIPGYAGLADQTTFDGRFYGSIRGVGGVLTVSGIEHLSAVERGGFNTIAHEFAHQIHTCALDPKTQARIHALYAKAIRTGKTLDYYAAANELEYFAQGYEAYVSLRKRPNLGPTGRHTRDELLQMDPELYRLIDELTRTSAGTFAKPK